jgi:hypothetical protein
MSKNKKSAARVIAAAALLFGSSLASATVLQLAPLLPSSTATGQGSDATFVRIDNQWHDSSVYWNESTGHFNAAPAAGFVAVGSLSWGSGLWGINDFRSALDGAVSSVESWSGRVARINHGDGCYNLAWSGAWGTTSLAPIFDAGTGCAEGDADPAQANDEDNWLAYFTGYIRVTEEDLYNFSVLYDDGFFFNLYGADGQASLMRDFLNPRDRLGFDEDLLLSPGLYRFELGAYDRLEAGVVDLRWQRGGATDWWLLPPEYLIDVTEPGAFALLGAGLLGLGLAYRRRRTQAPHVPDAA